MQRVYRELLPDTTKRHIQTLREEMELNGILIDEAGHVCTTETPSEENLIHALRSLVSIQSTTSTITNFAAGDIWNLACKRYGGGKELLVRAFGEENAAKMKAIFAPKGTIAKSVPKDRRDFTKSWSWYKAHYDRRTPRMVRQYLRPKRRLVDDNGNTVPIQLSVNELYTTVYCRHTDGSMLTGHLPTERLREDLQACEKKPVPVDSGLDEFVKEGAA